MNVPALDAILGKAFDVLDQGFIRVIDYMGSDAAIVQAARISYGKGTRSVQDDRALLRYLMRQAHTTPFEMCEIKLHVRVPMDCWRQWIRHRTASVNEYSTRYSEAIDQSQTTPPDGWRGQSTTNRQGSGQYLPTEVGDKLSAAERDFHSASRALYRDRLDAGVAREQARKDLPLATYTEAYWKIDLHNLLRFLRLRMDTHAQWEIRQCATTIGNEIVARWCPDAWQAFRDYEMDAFRFSAAEAQVVAALASGRQGDATVQAAALGKRERQELRAKLDLLNIESAWLTDSSGGQQ